MTWPPRALWFHHAPVRAADTADCESSGKQHADDFRKTRMKSQAQHSVFTRPHPPNWEHLKPLSVYSTMVLCKQTPTPDQPGRFGNSFMNLKPGVVNSHVNKRTLEHSSHDEGYETPAKKSFNAEVVSPDLGCFMDECSPLGQLDSVSPSAVSTPLDESRALRNEIKDSQHSEHVGDCGSSTEPGGTKRTSPLGCKPEEVVLNLAPAFDCDIDDILCLNPVGTHSVEGLSEHAQGCKCSHTFQNNAASLPTAAHGEALEDGQEGLKKEMPLKAKDEEADKGYFSISLKTEKSSPQSGNPQLATSASSHLVGPQGEQCAERSFEPPNKLLSSNDLYPLARCPPSESGTSDSLEGEVEGMWDIGPPIFESSLCHNVTVTLDTTGNKKREVVEEVCGDAREPLQECSSTHNREETTDSTYETTLPLQVQVKSVVVMPNQQTTSRQPHTPDERASQGVQRVTSQRPMFDRKMDWEREKNNYVHAVTKHMTEKGEATQDVMSELFNLMNSIADQTSARRTDAQWQHPSDITKKNYQRRWRNATPKWTLDEWQVKSIIGHRRFARVAKTFQRSPFP